MYKRLLPVAFAALLLSPIAKAQTPAGPTGICNDGSSTTAASKRGACSGHGGVKTWNSATATPAATVPRSPAPKPTQQTIPSAPQNSAPTTAALPTQTRTAPATQSGGAGQVWVNTPSKVYHCQGDRYYGHTKNGQYMTEQQAMAAGDRPDHGKTCSAR